MNHDEMTDEEFERRTLDVIHREFGLGGLTRFIRAYRSGRGDYTTERHQWQDGLSIDEIIAQIKHQRRKPPAAPPPASAS